MAFASAMLLYCLIVFPKYVFGIFLVIMAVGITKKNRRLVKIAWGVVFTYAGILVLTIMANIGFSIYFNKIPHLSVKGNQVTILNQTSKGYRGQIKYVYSKEGIVTLVDEPKYIMNRNQKYGFTFEAVASGELFISIMEWDDGVTIDVYRVDAYETGKMRAEEVEHIETANNDTSDYLANKYGFSKEEIDGLLGKQKDGEENKSMSYKTITMEEAKTIFESNDGTYIVLDVRTPEEFAEGHIPGAINVANESIVDVEPAVLTNKKQVIYVYCRSGNRSKQAAEKLVAMGYENIIEFGGIIDWTGEIER